MSGQGSPSRTDPVSSNSRKTPIVNRRGWTSLRQQDHMQILIPTFSALKQTNCPEQDHLWRGNISTSASFSVSQNDYTPEALTKKQM